jgi:hypothetical protein
MHDRLESETPWFLEEVEAARFTIGPGRLAIRSHFAIIVDLEEGQLRATASHGREEVRRLARSHLRTNARALVNARIEPRLCDSPSLVDEGLEIADCITFDHR